MNPVSKRFAIVSQQEEYGWSLFSDMGDYANENTEKLIPEKHVRDYNLDPVKKLDDFLVE